MTGGTNHKEDGVTAMTRLLAALALLVAVPTAAIAGGAALITGIIKLAISLKERTRTIAASLDVGVTHDTVFVMGRF